MTEMPSVDEMDKIIQPVVTPTSPEADALEKEICNDIEIKSDVVNECRHLPEISAKYACALAKLEHDEFQADEKVKSIRSKIILAFEDNPKAFLENVRHRNMQIVEAVYRAHPQYKKAVQEQLTIARMRKMVAQAAYAIDQKRSMLQCLMQARLAGIAEINMVDSPRGERVKNESESL